MSDGRPGVILVEPLPVVRAGLSALLQSRSGLRIVRQTGSSHEALDALEQGISVSAAVIGLGLERPYDAFWLIGAIRDRFPAVVVVACGARSDAATISRVLVTGASGFVDKSVDPDEFVSAVGLAVSGEWVIAGPPADWVGSDGRGNENGPVAEVLTDRELQVLNVAAEGLTAREIGARLGVRERTVTTHLSRIYGKLGVRTRIAAIRSAAMAGLVSPRGVN